MNGSLLSDTKSYYILMCVTKYSCMCTLLFFRAFVIKTIIYFIAFVYGELCCENCCLCSKIVVFFNKL